ncbi:2-methyl-6-phytyl-1,4-hydroquinone methyltransferase [Halomicronema hongdechloris C2206]|uniref:2-methyl-6-phytyl-1,4-hydroquinone methyltransferase n=1 Tax=Halomicronema hongdechloris C2206 TaxID=1641165 RepID=A0A1Z3HKQ4_9CYAN|nr:methyltransferase domain-containing protein [Halomicronema hongdechloris]ASC70902.1 2-methyl-6-phytyl-1,4-hydroquinone methyltransferase [Halomicronema hongdechloris C2206]
MNELNIQELVKVAEAYEQLLAPALFTEWTPRLADAADIQEGQHVLDVACGTGVLARVVAERVGRNGSVSGVDVNPGMLAVANRIAPAVEWREGDAESLLYANDSFDAVLSQFGLMLFAAPIIALQEMRRVLKPGGHLAVAVFGSLEDLPAYGAIANVYEHQVGKAVGDALRMPFSMGDPDTLASVFASAGITSAAIRMEEGMARFSSVRNMVLADVKGWFPFAGIHLNEDTIEAVVEEAETVLEAFQTDSGAVEFRVPVHIITATKS